MKTIIVRWRWFVLAVVGFVALLLAASGLAPQRVIPMGSVVAVSVSDAGASPVHLTPIRPERLVFLELLDFGYTPGRVQADELRYDRLGLEDGKLSRGQYHGRYTSLPPRYRGFEDVSGPLVITRRTKIAMNLTRMNTAVNAAPIPVLIDKIPWGYTSFGTSFVASTSPSRSGWLRHSLTIAEVGDDGNVVLVAGRSRVTLRPGGQVTVDRNFGWWSSTVTIRNRGIVLKDRVRLSDGLRVEW